MGECTKERVDDDMYECYPQPSFREFPVAFIRLDLINTKSMFMKKILMEKLLKYEMYPTGGMSLY